MAPDFYLDANATSPVLASAIAAAVEAMEASFGNPSSSHATGLRAKCILDTTRARARRVLGAGPGRVLFTSGATEGIQTAVLSALVAVRERRAAGEDCGDLLVYGATEHKAVSESLAHWNRLLGTGLTLQPLPVDATGRHRLDVLRDLAPRAALVCTMAANNETGVISDLDGIAGVLRARGSKAYWMVDCVQALGKLPLDLANTRIDYAPFSGHKLHAPKGIGILYVRDGAPYTPLMIGGGQEGGQRSGTENMVGIAALGAVLAALEEGTTFRTHAMLFAMRDRLAAALRDAFPAIVFNAPFEHTLPTTLNFAVPGVSSKDLLDLFDAAGVRVSAGSACSAAKAAPSYVLDAMGLPLWRSGGAVRLSIGPLADDAFIDAACARIRRCGDALRTSPLSGGDPGVMQVSGDGRHGWIVFDAGTCVAIDPPPGQVDRIAALARDAGLRMEEFDAAERATVALDDGGHAPCMAIGGAVLARVPGGWLLGEAKEGRLPRTAVRQVFGAIDADRLAQVAHAAAVICHTTDVNGLACATVGEVRDAGTPGQLHPDTLAVFLRRHEDALLVDVREAAEAAAGALTLHGRDAHHVPLSRLAEHLPGWLSDPARPIVFVCRSGNRSAKAALCLRRAGHAQAWTLVGGLALA
ncbi:aminotransferase class V-fold PLP-dependent enzyme [Telluria mixta]|uniref:cysteine desulfurase n=1 Tax=Telluria mixta TaxID=34071 RepID=A0ABT2BVE9_9BURK|nr:aminotransferase class V-fold PLP-dependent enzyme [Telluria mixta]MCS0629094.1 aminotransferase class V-fold PLP-dependent enzyme [Telluria mixta]WEM97538.1 aminotransferase class V-fold PLP-dependent enzyme [Telluria mixta]